MQRYNPKKIEKKWQDKWYKSGVFKAKNFSKKKKFYLLVEFPYPSGEGLHVGHCRSYTALDVIARYKRMNNFNVLYPMGWDAFGLPAENYAIKKRIHPSIITQKSVKKFKEQMKSLGLSFDWSREVNTTEAQYYKWTQWIFIKLFENGLAYKDKININWCPSCKIGLANEEVVDGKCERCGTLVEKKEKEQWLIKITKYAERLLEDLNLVDYPERVKIQQKEWIGRSDGALVKFPLEGVEDPIEVFTTRIDTIFSGTFLILSPGNKFIEKYKEKIENFQEVLEYIKKAKSISDIERSNLEKDVTGVEIKGILTRNPATGEEIPVWVADFVLENYGTGAVFADAHDKRDFKLAKKYGIPLRTSILPQDEESAHRVKNLEECFEGEGILHNSMQFDGLTSVVARPQIILWLQQKLFAESKTSYKLRDWIFSRQHYWGEPIPMVFCENCASLPGGQGWQAVYEKELPIELPKVKKYQPTDTGESPLAGIKSWVNAKCPKCNSPAKRETDTMPNWAGSNWYYLAYPLADKLGNSKFEIRNSKFQNIFTANKDILAYWLPVDWYNGGMEHTTLHLLYSRFIFKFLYDIGAVPESVGPEPYQKRTSHGVILGQGGVKMSKSKGNVINPDDVVKQYGADTLRVYEMFMGPFGETIPWDSKNIIGCRRFLEKVYRLTHQKVSSMVRTMELKVLLNKTIKKVSEDIELMKFNTAISSLMEFINRWQTSENGLDKEDLAKFLIILSPFAPHLTEELWKVSGFNGLCSQQKWPQFNKNLLREEKILLIAQINGRVRDKIEIDFSIQQKEVEKLVLSRPKIKSWIGRKKIKKIIFVADKLVNIVI